MSKEIVFLIKVMQGGGAERVISLLSRSAVECGNKVSLIITHQNKTEAVLNNIDSRIKVISLPDEISGEESSVAVSKLIMLSARIIGKLGFREKSSVLKQVLAEYTCRQKEIPTEKIIAIDLVTQ